MAKRTRKEKLSIYLVKADVTEVNQMLKMENVSEPISLELTGGNGVLYRKREQPKPPPPWTRMFTTLPEVPDDAFGWTNSVGAILLFRTRERTFLLSFGSGFHLLQEDAIERDFGLRVTLNSVEPSKIRSLDKATYDHRPLNSRTQSPRDVDLFDLDVDSETDMLYAVTGTSKVPIFGQYVTGRDALTLLVESNVNQLAPILQEALRRYQAKLAPEFEWVENIHKVRDTDTLELLDLFLNELLSAGSFESIWMGEPEIVDWERLLGYAFDMRERTLCHPTLELEALQKYLAEKGSTFTVDVLKGQPIYLLDGEHQSIHTWTAYRCIYAEIRDGDNHYLLRNATWYKVKPDFVAEVEKYISGIAQSTLNFPSYAHQSEGEYNKHVCCSDMSFALMDRINKRIGGPYDKIEFCDLIKDHVNLIHVKCYRSSSTLSHLFAQGSVASEAFVKDETFRERLNPSLPKASRLVDPKVRPDPSKYTVVFAIVTTKAVPSEIPFFSKVTLKNAARTLSALNFKVETARIPIDHRYIKTAKVKPPRQLRKT
jgi:uncharacterized protein (TIGR04141 family)